MNPTAPNTLGLDKLKATSRRSVEVSEQSLVTLEALAPGQALPLVIKPAVPDLDLARWAGSQRAFLEERLLEHGGILFRGFAVGSVGELEALIEALFGSLLEYSDRVQPRSQVSKNIYTSTEYPPDQVIEFHNEAAYAHTWPKRIFFLCLQPSEEGGETPIADCRRVLTRLDPALRQSFVDKKVLYLRNLGGGFGIDWQTAFQTEDRAVMEAFCRKNGIELEWTGEDRLRTRSVRPVVIRHPDTGQAVWFNAAVSSHVSTLAPAVREALLAELSEIELPKNSFYGDGTPIEPETLAAIRAAYHAETVAFPWQKGDVLMLDNMLVAHARNPYRGARKVVVGMASPVSVEDVQ